MLHSWLYRYVLLMILSVSECCTDTQSSSMPPNMSTKYQRLVVHPSSLSYAQQSSPFSTSFRSRLVRSIPVVSNLTFSVVCMARDIFWSSEACHHAWCHNGLVLHLWTWSVNPKFEAPSLMMSRTWGLRFISNLITSILNRPLVISGRSELPSILVCSTSITVLTFLIFLTNHTDHLVLSSKTSLSPSSVSNRSQS